MIDEALGAVDAGAAPMQRGREATAVDDASRGSRRVELVATVLLAVATVATAWSGYQSTSWNGEQARQQPAPMRSESIRQGGGLANTQTEIDVATFTQWVNAYAQKQTCSRTSTSNGSARSSGQRSTPGSRPGH